MALGLAVWLVMVPLNAEGANPPKALFDTVLDFDGDGVLDRAVILVTGAHDGDWDPLEGYAYSLQENEDVELAVYLGGGASPLDLAKTPDFRGAYLVHQDLYAWIQPMDVTPRNSLKLSTAYAPGASNTAEQILTLVWRGGEPVVAGYTIGWETRNGAGTCDVNLLTGKALLFEGIDLSGPGKSLKGKFNPVPLRNWSEQTRPKVCDEIW
jgi:hypothetical protein